MSAWTAVTIEAMRDEEREILDRMDERLARLDEWIKAGVSPALIDVRDELQISRTSYEHQLVLTRRLVERTLRAFDTMDERMDQRFDKSFARVERALDENTQVLRSIRDALTGENGAQN